MRRRWLLFAGAALGGLVVLGVLVVALGYGSIARRMIEGRVLPRVDARLGRHVAVGAIDVSPGVVVLRDVVVPGDDGAPLVSVAEIRAEVAYWPSLRGEVRLGEVALVGIRIVATRRRDGDTYSALIARLRGDGGGDGAAPGARRPRPTAIVVRDARVELRDERGQLTLIAAGVEGRAVPGGEARAKIGELAAVSALGPTATLRAIEVAASFPDPLATASVAIGDGELALWRGMSLTGVQGTVAHGDRPGVLAIDLRGGYAGVDGTLWNAKGWIDPRAQTGDLRLAADRFRFSRIAPVLERSAVVEFDDTSMDAVVELRLDGDLASVTAEASIAGLNLFHPKLAAGTLRGLAGKGRLVARYHRAARALDLEQARASIGGVDYTLSGRLERTGGVDPSGAPRVHRRVAARLVIPPVGCQAMLESIPAEFAPALQGFKLTGSFATDVSIAVDWADLEATRLDGAVGIRGCKVKRAPDDMDVERLTATFDHQVEVAEDEWKTMQIGPESEDFVALADVSPHLINSLMTTEDSGFYKHRGFIAREFRTALVKDLEAGYFKYGASSITMQTVKNVFLDREKTLSRKFQELFLAWYLEHVLEKDRILEIYVNAIEYGPGLYGIKPAAMQYFGKHPRDLSPTEAAFFSSILPAPKQRYIQFCKDKVTSWTIAKIQRILELMVKRERLSVPEFEVAMATPLIFQPDKGEFCTRKWEKKQP